MVTKTTRILDYKDVITTRKVKDYHCKCEYCQNVVELYDTKNNAYYSNAIRNKLYTKAKHICPGQSIGYRYFIQKYTTKNDVTIDPFGGTGTTAIESFYMGRKSYISEIEYSDVTELNLSRNNIKLLTLFKGNALDMMSCYPYDVKSKCVIVTGPPYPTYNKISSDAPERKNLSNKKDNTFDYKDVDSFGKLKEKECMESFRKTIQKIVEGTNVKYICIIVKDLMKNKKPYNLHKLYCDSLKDLKFKYDSTFIHKHIPSTLFINTYEKRNNVKCVKHQTGIVLVRK